MISTFTADGVMGAVISMMGIIVTIGLTMITGLIWLIREMANMKTKVNELWEDRRAQWEFFQSRADQEAVNKGYGKKRSPLNISGLPDEERVIQAYTPILNILIKAEQESGLDATKEEQISDLWKKLAVNPEVMKALSEGVCPALDLAHGGCVSLAIAFLRHQHGLRPAAFCVQDAIHIAAHICEPVPAF